MMHVIRRATTEQKVQILLLASACLFFLLAAPAATLWAVRASETLELDCGTPAPTIPHLAFRLTGCAADLTDVVVEERAGLATAVYVPLRGSDPAARPVWVLRSTDRALVRWASRDEPDIPPEVTQWAAFRDLDASDDFMASSRSDISPSRLLRVMRTPAEDATLVSEGGAGMGAAVLLGGLWLSLLLSIGGLVQLVLVVRRRQAAAGS